MCTQGINGDGMVYYDFPWSGSGTEATDEQVSQIPPIYATETEEGSPTYTPPPGAAPPVSFSWVVKYCVLFGKE